MAVLDTSILIDLLRRRAKKRPDALAKLAELEVREEPLFTTLFCVAELHIGIKRSDNPSRDRAEMDKLLLGLTILNFRIEAAELYGTFTAEQQILGRPVGDMDTLIAATALAHGQTVIVTRNPGHFANFAGLAVESY